jgi:tetratricopeptide (TPR) repeat protein
MGNTSTNPAAPPGEQAEPRVPCGPDAPIRPLPLGAFPLPFGFLLLPPGEETEPIRLGLLAGVLPAQWPPALHGHRAALAGDLDAARLAFGGTDAVSRFNRFVIDPETVDAVALRADLRAPRYGAPLDVLVDLVEFATGRSDIAPDPAGHDEEIRALLLAAAAVQSLSSVPGLREAVAAARPVSPALAGVLQGALAQACKEAGDPAAAAAALQAGIALLARTDLAVARAEQHLELAATYHELAAGAETTGASSMMAPGMLGQAVQHYHNALQAVDAETAPEVWAAAHAGLAAAYLTMPMTQAGDQLRLGVAVGSLRAALTVYTPQTHPAQWSSAQLNLANALVYAPSKHQGDNLTEAVELYEAVLAARERASDPVGYARALANQGNALAHLGLFDQARAKLAEARYLFEESQDWSALATVRTLLDDLARQQKFTREVRADA